VGSRVPVKKILILKRNYYILDLFDNVKNKNMEGTRPSAVEAF